MELSQGTIITIIGWFAAFGFAMWQVRVSQRSQLRLFLKAEQYKQFLELHTEIIKANLALKSAIGFIQVNMSVDESMTLLNGGQFGWKDKLNCIDDAYATLCEKIGGLDIWLSAANEGISNSEEIYSVIHRFNEQFTITENFPVEHPWLAIQGTIIRIRSGSKVDAKYFTKATKPVVQLLNEMKNELEVCAKSIQKSLLTELG